MDLSGAVAANENLTNAENELAHLQTELDYYNDVVTTINNMNSGGGIFDTYYGPRVLVEWEAGATDSLKYNPRGKFYNRARKEFAVEDDKFNVQIGKTYTYNNNTFFVKDFKKIHTNAQTGRLNQYDTINSFNTQIQAKKDKIAALKLEKEAANKDELQKITELYLLTHESHNKLRLSLIHI